MPGHPPLLTQRLQLRFKLTQDIRAPAFGAEDDFPAPARGNDEGGGLVVEGEGVGVGTDCFGGFGVEVGFADVRGVEFAGAAVGGGVGGCAA